MKKPIISDRALVRVWMASLLVAALGGVAAGNAPRLFPDSLGGVLSTVLWCFAGAGVMFSLVFGMAASRRAAQ